MRPNTTLNSPKTFRPFARAVENGKNFDTFVPYAIGNDKWRTCDDKLTCTGSPPAPTDVGMNGKLIHTLENTADSLLRGFRVVCADVIADRFKGA